MLKVPNRCFRESYLIPLAKELKDSSKRTWMNELMINFVMDIQGRGGYAPGTIRRFIQQRFSLWKNICDVVAPDGEINGVRSIVWSYLYWPAVLVYPGMHLSTICEFLGVDPIEVTRARDEMVVECRWMLIETGLLQTKEIPGELVEEIIPYRIEGTLPKSAAAPVTIKYPKDTKCMTLEGGGWRIETSPKVAALAYEGIPLIYASELSLKGVVTFRAGALFIERMWETIKAASL